ncbi:MAG: MATE family efflux transporter [Clostridium sp.]
MSDTAVSSENKMGTMPVNKLLITMSLPMIASMLVQALYNIVDSIFVAQIGENALTAVSLAFPIQSLMIAVAVGTCVGINALLSRCLGEKRQNDANLTAINGVFISFASYLIFAVIGLLGTGAFFRSQTSNPEVIKYGTEYLSICMIFSFGLFMEMTLERIMQSTGRTIYSMVTQGIGAIINIVLDPIMIFGLFGFPKLGIRGAAIATVTGQIIAMILAYSMNREKNPDVLISFKHFRPNLPIIKKIYKVGIPSIVMQSIISVMTLGMNTILLMFSETAVSVLGIYFKLQSFVFMPIFGLNNGMIPIVAYNYGAQNKKRIIDTIKLSAAIAIGIMFIGLIIFQVFPVGLFKMFNASDHMLEVGVPALRIISTSFMLAGYCIIISSVFQAMGNGMYSLITAVARQLVCILPLAYLFAKYLGLYAVWYAFPMAELICVIITTYLFRKIYINKIKPLGMED